MKDYQNPQPQAVEKADKEVNQPKPTNLKENKHKETNQSITEIYENESEERAWRHDLKKEPYNKSD